MSPAPILLTLLAAFLGLSPAPLRDLTVVDDEQNVVASRLIGEWSPDEELGTRLGTQAKHELSFERDASVLGEIPPPQADFLKGTTIYLAGKKRSRSSDGATAERVFVLVEKHGNPLQVIFRSRSGSGPIDDVESSIVTLVPARDRANDMLFLGGDFNNEPFRAWKRKSAAK